MVAIIYLHWPLWSGSLVPGPGDLLLFACIAGLIIISQLGLFVFHVECFDCRSDFSHVKMCFDWLDINSSAQQCHWLIFFWSRLLSLLFWMELINWNSDLYHLKVCSWIWMPEFLLNFFFLFTSITSVNWVPELYPPKVWSWIWMPEFLLNFWFTKYLFSELSPRAISSKGLVLNLDAWIPVELVSCSCLLHFSTFFFKNANLRKA